MDKQRTKVAYAGEGLPFVDSVIASREAVEAAHVMKPPYVIKPNNEGSSVGIYIVSEAANGPPQMAREMPDQVMVETYAPGRELTTTVMGDRALGVTDILTDGWYVITPNTKKADRATLFRLKFPPRSPKLALIMRSARIAPLAVAVSAAQISVGMRRAVWTG